MSWYDSILFPFKWILAWIMVGIHKFLTTIGFPDGPGSGWLVTIVVLTIAVNLVTLPLYLKQIRSTRGMAVLQPEMKRIREKYAGRNDAVSKQQMQQETMALYSKYQVNPMASCLPMLIQLPVMLALYRLLWQVPQIAHDATLGIGGFDQQLAIDMENTSLFGLLLSDTFASNHNPEYGKTVIIVMVFFYALIMFATQFVMVKWNMADSNPQQAMMMKSMMYVFPLMSFSIGFVVQFGLLIYLVVTMLFGIFRQLGFIYYLPTPDSPAHKKMMERNQIKLDNYKAEIKQQCEKEYAALEITSEDLLQAQKIALKKRKEGEDLAAAFAEIENGEKLLKAFQIFSDSQEKIHKKAQDLELEKKPLQPAKAKRGIFMRAMETAQQNQQLGNSQRNTRNQPKRTNRADRGKNKKYTQSELEQRRKARRNQK